jgi:putative ABC transport system permease protein
MVLHAYWQEKTSMLLTDLKIAVRRLRRHPGYALGLITTLALGIAVCAAMYSVVHGVAIRGLDYPEAQRLVVLSAENRRNAGDPAALAGAEAEALGELTRTFESTAYYMWGGATWLGGERPRMLTGIIVGGDFFATLGREPALGRWLGAADDGNANGVVLSHGAWQTLFGGAADVIGKPLTLDWITGTVVGVMPADFGYPGSGIDFWLGHDMARVRADPPLYVNARFFNAIGRLRADADPVQVAAELERFSEGVAERHGGTLGDWRLATTSMLDDTIGQVRPVLLALFAIAALALLVACANVVNLVVLRGVSRLHELGVHQALGASRARLARTVFAETLLLGLAATVVGVLLAALALAHFVGIGDSGVPRAASVRLDPMVLGVATAIGLLASLAAAALPALRLRRLDASEVLRGADARVVGGSGVSRLLPVAACAVSVGGLAAALLLTSSVWRLERIPLGYAPAPVLSLHLFRDEDPSAGGYVRELRERLAALPGVQAAASMSGGPMSFVGMIPVDLQVQGRPAQEPLRPTVRTVSGPVQEVLQLGLERGRWLDDADRADGEPVAIVNRAFASRVFGDTDPIGQVVTIPPFGSGGDRLPFRIVGVMADARLANVARPAQPEVWLPEPQYFTNSVNLLLRADGDPTLLLKPAQEAVWARHPEQGIYQARLLADARDRQLATPRFFARNAGAFAALALLLAAIGVHSVVAFQMARRRRELALRVALGSGVRGLIGRVLRYGYGLGVPAAAAGVLLGVGFGRLLQGAVVGVENSVWPAALASAAILLLVVLAACARSMLGVSRIEPMQVLRND